jgi:hypothetical protein
MEADSLSRTFAVIARPDRAIQYAALYRSIAGVSGILDHPLSRMMTGGVRGALRSLTAAP